MYLGDKVVWESISRDLVNVPPPDPGAQAGFGGRVKLYASTPPWPGGTERRLISDRNRVAIRGQSVTVAVGVLRGTDGCASRVEQMMCW